MAESDDDLSSGPERLPRPDPTRLTTAALQREISAVQQVIKALREVLEAKLDGTINAIHARLDGMDKALTLLQDSTDRVPSDVDIKLTALANLIQEKFRSIDTQFGEKERQTIQLSEASKEAVRSALDAQKEAVSKSEMNTVKQIDQLGTLINTTTLSLNEKIDASTARAETAVAALRAELLPQISGERTRGDRGEGRQMGQGAMLGIIFGAIGALGVIIGFIVLLTQMRP